MKDEIKKKIEEEAESIVPIRIAKWVEDGSWESGDVNKEERDDLIKHIEYGYSLAQQSVNSELIIGQLTDEQISAMSLIKYPPIEKGGENMVTLKILEQRCDYVDGMKDYRRILQDFPASQNQQKEKESDSVGTWDEIFVKLRLLREDPKSEESNRYGEGFLEIWLKENYHPPKEK
jgi:hypothetical protein